MKHDNTNYYLKINDKKIIILLILFSFIIFFNNPVASQHLTENEALDKRVKNFLTNHKHSWVDYNVPAADGRFLYDLIIKKKYKNAVEIGTSTGRSAIWIAWALSNTGGKLITIEINESRYRKAIANFKEAGLSEYIDARLGDAHKMVPKLKGSFDFVFCDADKHWYKNYLIALIPKLKKGGCFTAHNVSWSNNRFIRRFLDYARSLSNFKTTIHNSSRQGISKSCKKK